MSIDATTTDSDVAIARVVDYCARLIRFDTSNYGNGTSSGESDAAGFIVENLRAIGLDPVVLEKERDRSNVVLRLAGADRSLPALLIHAHLDVVPAEAEQWTVPPFGGLVDDGYIWGRGAIDMKDMAAAMLETIVCFTERGVRPQRDLVFAFVADEEDKGEFGALWLASEHPELFAGVGAAIGESGGSPSLVPAADGSSVHLYPIAAAERGTMHMRLTATGRSGHGSRPIAGSATASLVAALARIVDYEWPVHLSPVVRDYLEQTAAALGLDVDLDTDRGVLECVDALGPAGEIARYTIRASATPTMLEAGYKVNVIPGIAHAQLDVRTPPGFEDELLATIDRLLGDAVTREFVSLQLPVQSPVDSEWFRAMADAVRRNDPDAVVVPFCMGGGTDAKAFAALGIRCYGFAPLGRDPDGRTPSGAHGVDERIPIVSLIEGQRVLADFLSAV
jgi:acetylornithine deacetylase/succinyl-diaminopimelate desuccinylase-like protein